MRLKKLRKLMSKNKIGTLIISHPINRRYLSGFEIEDPQIGESSGVLLVSQGEAILATDPRYAEIAKEEAQNWDIYIYKQDFFEEISEILKNMPSPLGFEALHLTYYAYQRLKETIKKKGSPLKIIPTKGLVEGLRKIKEATEITIIKEAIEMTEQIFMELKTFLKPGLTEKDVAWHIEVQIRQNLNAEFSFSPIVASGHNAAIPHAVPTPKRLKPKEPIIIDFGVRWKGYCADMTRTFYLGEPDAKFKEIYNLVLEAQNLAISQIKKGLKTYQVDAMARDFLKEKGYANFFLHSLGHGVGLLVHEAPSLSPRRPGEMLETNMVATIEPGLYLSGWGGVRIEDMVVFRENGCERLNKLSTDLKDWTL